MTENKSFKIQDGEQPPYDASKGLDAESCAYELCGNFVKMFDADKTRIIGLLYGEKTMTIC